MVMLRSLEQPTDSLMPPPKKRPVALIPSKVLIYQPIKVASNYEPIDNATLPKRPNSLAGCHTRLRGSRNTHYEHPELRDALGRLFESDRLW